MVKSRFFLLFLSCSVAIALWSQPIVTISDPDSWKASDLSAYVGQTVQFATPFYVCNHGSSSITISPRRLYTPTNQAYPGSSAYNTILAANNSGTIRLNNISSYPRLGQRIDNLKVYVNSTTQLTPSGTVAFTGNGRQDLSAHPNLGDYTLKVCGFNLNYYIVEDFDGSFGPANASQAAKQHTKIMAALNAIDADIYGFSEIQQGQSALQKIADALTTSRGRKFAYINDGGSTAGTYTKVGYVYCSDIVEPLGELTNLNNIVQNRKKIQGFRDKRNDERFILSLNHFKAKSGVGTGNDADQGDGQGHFNASRVAEATAVLSALERSKNYYADVDLLVIGDLNAYAKEDPIKLFTDAGYYDLYRQFHGNEGYSYSYRGEAGYLDHALANQTMLEQITGMAAYHINSDESSRYTYSSTDATMFRSSDHDPVLVGLRLGEYKTVVPKSFTERVKVINNMSADGTFPKVINADGSLLLIHSISGVLIYSDKVNGDEYNVVTSGLPAGIYIVTLYGEGVRVQQKIVVR